MGLFDALREKASELLSGAGDKVSELTGTDLADTQQNVTDSAQNLGDTAQDLGGSATGAAQGFADTATESVQGYTDPLTGDHLDPRGPQ